MSLTLIFDLGTTYFKAVVFSADGEALSICRRPTPTKSFDNGYVEMEPDAFRQTLIDLVAEGREKLGDRFEQIDRVSFATQANTFCLLDAEDHPLIPWILWTDQRAEGINLPSINDYSITGIPRLTTRFSLAKLCWLRINAQEVWGQARRLIYLSDDLTRWLTGRHVTAADVASLTGLLNIHTLTWREDAIATLGLDSLAFPQPLRPGTAIGPLDPAAAKAIGLPPSAIFHVGCLDQYAAAYATDLSNTDGICETTGTVLATVTAATDFDPALETAGIYQGPASPSGYFRMLFGDVSANLIAAYRKQHAPELTYEQLDALAADEKSAGPHGPAVREIYRRVADALRDQIHTLRPSSDYSHIFSLGGGAQSKFWLKLKADRLGLPCRPLATDEPTALGIARLLDAAG